MAVLFSLDAPRQGLERYPVWLSRFNGIPKWARL
jgi:hypothetical protein